MDWQIFCLLAVAVGLGPGHRHTTATARSTVSVRAVCGARVIFISRFFFQPDGFFFLALRAQPLRLSPRATFRGNELVNKLISIGHIPPKKRTSLTQTMCF